MSAVRVPEPSEGPSEDFVLRNRRDDPMDEAAGVRDFRAAHWRGDEAEDRRRNIGDAAGRIEGRSEQEIRAAASEGRGRCEIIELFVVVAIAFS